jgi:HlyD family secretion protein
VENKIKVLSMNKRVLVSIAVVCALGAFAWLLVRAKSDATPATKPHSRHVVVAKMQSINTPLFFHGVLAPIATKAVLSPVDGTVNSTYFKYGVKVSKGGELFAISSQQLRDKFNQGLDAYLQKKSGFEIQQSKFKGTQDLYNHGIISRDEYVSEKSSFESMSLSYAQAKSELEKVLVKVKVDPATVENLTYAEDQSVKKSLASKFSNIVVSAPEGGVALFPIAGQSGSSSDNNGSGDGKVVSGTSIKEGQLMLSVGDLSGYRANLQVNEVQVNKVRPGMMVKITGDAFPGITIPGRVDTVALQASPDNSGSNMSLFNVSVVAPKIPVAAAKIIHVGMTCQVEVILASKPMLMIPMAAVKHDKFGRNSVLLKDHSGEHQVAVITGLTTPAGQIAILHGLKQGDQVYVNS